MKRVVLYCVVACALSAALVTGARAAVEYQVQPGPGEVNWRQHPEGTKFVDFEYLTEGSVLGDVVPGVRFTTTSGYDWRVGRFSSGNYNGKYPYGSYTSEGDAFAWMGPAQGSGIITTTVGKASYFSFMTSTYSGVTVDAYDEYGNFLESSGWATNNLNTGTMDRLVIHRQMADIRYVVVHDAGDYWLLDSMVTDAPGVENPVPEPSSLLALGSGLVGLGGVFFRRRPPSPRLRRTGRR